MLFTAITGAVHAVLAATHVHGSHSSHSESAGISEGLSVSEIAGNLLLHSLQTVYFAMLLLAAGIALLHLAITATEIGSRQRALMTGWGAAAAKGLFVAALVHIFVQSNRIASELAPGNAQDWLRLFTETSSGQSWLALLVLSVVGLAVMRLADPFKIAWALLLLAAEAFNGHAAAANESTVTIIADFIHLASAAGWVGGVLLMLLFWRKDRELAASFAERFVSYAWITIVLLTVTGVVVACMLLPTPQYLIHTVWGQWLLGKAALVLLVILFGIILRLRMRRRELPLPLMLKVEIVLLIAILVAAAVLSSQSPVPHSEPVQIHQMGEELHYTLKISPNSFGPNDVQLTLWLPEASEAPNSVALYLNPTGHENEQIDVQMTTSKRSGDFQYEFPGFKERQYEAGDVQLTKPGEWVARIVITGANGEITKRELTFKSGM